MRTLEQALGEDTGAHTDRASELVSIRSDSHAGRLQHRMSQRPVACNPFSLSVHFRIRGLYARALATSKALVTAESHVRCKAVRNG
jgi:hypothetical protein